VRRAHGAHHRGHPSGTASDNRYDLLSATRGDRWLPRGTQRGRASAATSAVFRSSARSGPTRKLGHSTIAITLDTYSHVTPTLIRGRGVVVSFMPVTPLLDISRPPSPWVLSHVAPNCRVLHRCWHQSWHQTDLCRATDRAQSPMFIAVSHNGGVAERSNAAVLKFDLGHGEGVRQRPPASEVDCSQAGPRANEACRLEDESVTRPGEDPIPTHGRLTPCGN
jgi:hypothetical protein